MAIILARSVVVIYIVFHLLSVNLTLHVTTYASWIPLWLWELRF